MVYDLRSLPDYNTHLYLACLAADELARAVQKKGANTHMLSHLYGAMNVDCVHWVT